MTVPLILAILLFYFIVKRLFKAHKPKLRYERYPGELRIMESLERLKNQQQIDDMIFRKSMINRREKFLARMNFDYHSHHRKADAVPKIPLIPNKPGSKGAINN